MTARQAERLHHRIDLAVAKVEDDLHALRAVVTDHSESTDGIADEVREMAERLHAIVDRRRRRVT